MLNFNPRYSRILFASALSVAAFAGCEQELGISLTAYRCTSSSDCIQGFVCRDLGDGRGDICVDDALAGVEPDAAEPDGGDASGHDARSDADTGSRPSAFTVELADAVQTSAASKIVGGREMQQFGSILIGVDFNNDGLPDLAVGAPAVDGGRVYLFHGNENRAYPQNARDADQTWGVAVGSDEQIGSGLAGGDIIGGTSEDLIIGARGADASTGAVFLLTGTRLEPPDELVDLSDASNHRKVLGAQPDAWLGASVAALGNVSGEGYRDVVLGAPRYSDGTSNVGAVYLVLDLAGFGGDAHVSGGGTIAFVGSVPGGQVGEQVASAGNFDGDEYADFLIGAPKADEAYLILGSADIDATSTHSLADADLTIPGARGSKLGQALASVGDIDDDGYDDILIGASDGRGEAYLIRGRADVGTRHFDLSSADLKFVPGSPGAPGPLEVAVGTAVASAGDVDGDGIEDILIGAGATSADSSTSHGAVYLVYGSTLLAHLDDGVFYLDDADVRFVGEDAGDNLGGALAGVGDVDGDGCDDILMGARRHSPQDSAGDEHGAVYLVFGPARGAEQTCD